MGRSKKTVTRFINGRAIDGNPRTLTPDAYDLSECPMHVKLTDAIKELSARVHETPAIAPYLQTLLCEVDQMGCIIHYTPVRSGAVVQAIQGRK